MHVLKVYLKGRLVRSAAQLRSAPIICQATLLPLVGQLGSQPAAISDIQTHKYHSSWLDNIIPTQFNGQFILCSAFYHDRYKENTLKLQSVMSLTPSINLGLKAQFILYYSPPVQISPHRNKYRPGLKQEAGAKVTSLKNPNLTGCSSRTPNFSFSGDIKVLGSLRGHLPAGRVKNSSLERRPVGVLTRYPNPYWGLMQDLAPGTQGYPHPCLPPEGSGSTLGAPSGPGLCRQTGTRPGALGTRRLPGS